MGVLNKFKLKKIGLMLCFFVFSMSILQITLVKQNISQIDLHFNEYQTNDLIYNKQNEFCF